MKIFVIGKLRSITHWTEDCVAGFRAAGHTVHLAISRNPRIAVGIERLLMSRWTGAFPVRRICRQIRAFQPDLILVIDPYAGHASLLARVAALRDRPPMVGWVGDQYPDGARDIAGLFDAVAYTDTGLLALHRDRGFVADAAYVPHAANPRLDLGVGDPASRNARMVFVANPTPHRSEVVAGLREPVALYGPGWDGQADGRHDVHARRVGIEELAAIYRGHLAVLNIRNEQNVMHGLNQRHFDPCLSGTPVVTDNQPDVSACFEPGREMLVYRDIDELNEIHARMLREPGYALEIGKRGRRRVMDHHLYGHRLEALARLGGIPQISDRRSRP
ncbi:MAG: glycosyltransferase [Acetobacteraceae bacterium]